MRRIFVRTRSFDRKWVGIGLTEADFRALELDVLRDPKKYPVISGTGGIRKMRWALPGRGKRGSIRVFYIDFETFEHVFMVWLLQKNEAENLAADEKAILYRLVATIEESLRVRFSAKGT